MIQRCICLGFLITLAGCRESPKADSRTEHGGTVVIATSADPDALFPPLTWVMEGRQATELIYEYLADVGPSMNTIGEEGFVRQLASGWKWSPDSMSLAFSIEPKARWHDGISVTARDVAFSFEVYRDSTVGSIVRESLADIDSVTVSDSLTAVFWFRRRTPHQFYDAAAQMLIIPQHVFGIVPRDSLRAFSSARAPIGSGRYRFGSWTRGSHFDVIAVPRHYRGAAGTRRIVWTITPEYKTALARLLGGEADVFANVRQETIPELTARNQFRLISLPGMAYAFMAFNLRDKSNQSRPHRLFESRDLRRAITMSLDRDAMVRNLFDTLASVSIGPTVRAYPTTDVSVKQIPFDRAHAERILDSLGWRRDKPGATRTKNGIPLKFDVIVPVSSLSRSSMALMIQEQLRQVGIAMKIEQMDFNTFGEREKARNFDAELGAWTLTSSPGSVRDAWGSHAAAEGGLNRGAYRNPIFDALVDSALSAPTTAASRNYFTRANQVIVDDAPAVWLYEPRMLIAVHRRIRTTPMRPNSWWLDIAGWRIPVAERLPRDNAPGS